MQQIYVPAEFLASMPFLRESLVVWGPHLVALLWTQGSPLEVPRDSLWYLGLNPSQLCAKQVPNLLYYLRGPISTWELMAYLSFSSSNISPISLLCHCGCSDYRSHTHLLVDLGGIYPFNCRASTCCWDSDSLVWAWCIFYLRYSNETSHLYFSVHSYICSPGIITFSGYHPWLVHSCCWGARILKSSAPKTALGTCGQLWRSNLLSHIC